MSSSKNITLLLKYARIGLQSNVQCANQTSKLPKHAMCNGDCIISQKGPAPYMSGQDIGLPCHRPGFGSRKGRW